MDIQKAVRNRDTNINAMGANMLKVQLPTPCSKRINLDFIRHFVVFEMSTSSMSVSSKQMGNRFNIRQGIAWYFMQKVRNAMKSSQNYPLPELIPVDEFTFGGKEQGKQGRSYDSIKKKTVIAVELS